MKGKILLVSILFLCASPLWAQNSEVLLTIGSTEISKTEFERIYRKNNENLAQDSKTMSPNEYLDLFIDYKLKVLEAQNQQMDTSAAFKAELAGYREELSAPYLTNMEFDDTLIKEMHNRMGKEVDASHILFRVNENATPEEEQEVFNKALEVKQEIEAGEDFDRAAATHSDDPGGKENGGRLGYFTAFQMVAKFEDAAFNTPPGEISEPVRTRFGYHLVKVHDVRPNKGEIKVAHIMKMFPQSGENFDKSGLKEKIDSIYTALQNGADFAETAQKYSDDKRSGSQGGEMPWFSAGRMRPEFSEQAFALKKAGDMTPPFESVHGFHIIKKLDHRPVPSFENARPYIEGQLEKDPARSTGSKKAFIEKLKEEYSFKENRENIEKLETLPLGEKTNEKLLLFTLSDINFHLNDLKNFVEKGKYTKGSYSDYYEQWVESEIIDTEDANLEEKHPEFNYILQEYHDGMLLFNIMEEKVWQMAAYDSTGLEKFYRKNKGKYMWEERFEGLVITCKNLETREEAEKFFDSGMTRTEVEDLLNENGEMVEIEQGTWEEGSNPAVDYFIWNSPNPGNFNPELTFVRGKKIPPEPKKLNEARGLVISDYQKFLERNWLKELRKKYKIKVNKKILKTIPHV